MVNDMDIKDFKPCRKGPHALFSMTEKHCTYAAKNPDGKYVRQFKVDGDVFPKIFHRTDAIICFWMIPATMPIISN